MKNNPIKKQIPTQQESVLADLKAGKGITTLSAINDYGCLSLSRIIWQLREDGHNIVNGKIYKRSKRGAHYPMAEYKLIQ